MRTALLELALTIVVIAGFLAVLVILLAAVEAMARTLDGTDVTSVEARRAERDERRARSQLSPCSGQIEWVSPQVRRRAIHAVPDRPADEFGGVA